MYKVVLNFLFILFFNSVLTAQTATLSIASVSAACADQEVLVSVNAVDLLNVGAITMYIGIDTLQVKYLGMENINSQMYGFNSNLMVSPSQIGITWTNLTPANIIADKVFDLRFRFLGETTLLVFNPGAMITDINLQPINTTFINGAIYSGIPVISQNPSNVSVHQGGNVLFQVISPNATGYSWMESKDAGSSWQILTDNNRYIGTSTSQLQILNTPLSFTQYIYRCKLLNGECFSESTHATLTVDSLTLLSEKKYEAVELRQNYPNPASNYTFINYSLDQPGRVKISFYDIHGRFIEERVNLFQDAGDYTIHYDLSSYLSGIYYYSLEFSNLSMKSSLQRKLLVSKNLN